MFTPGPWHVGLRQSEQIVYNDKGWAIANATVYHGKSDLQETKDNARLIAAAPEMYYLLKDIYNCDDDIDGAKLMNKAKELISKIDGK